MGVARHKMFFVIFGALGAIGFGFFVTLTTQTDARAQDPRAESGPASCDTCSVAHLSANRLIRFLQPAKQNPTVGTRGYLGLQSCNRCHREGNKDNITLPGGVEIPLETEQWVLYKEIPIWADKDKHAQAYTVLLNDRSKAMARLLVVPDAHRDQRCLACHTGFPLSQMPVEKDGFVDREIGKKPNISLGVSCEGCHGPSGQAKSDDKMLLNGWLSSHQEPPVPPYDKTKPWRFLLPKQKLEKHGFVDVRSPASKTKLCVSCHIGDVEQGRMVTHEMYAAGHPPLPSFEIETFVAQMPKHWAEFSEKPEQVQDLFLKFTNDPIYKDPAYKKNLQRTRSLLAGALVVSSEYLRLAGQLADEHVQSPVKRGEWPELATFDCYACHHELKNPSWRQKRKPPTGIPGRPALQDWPFVLAKIALKMDGVPTGDVNANLAEVRKVLNAQPFGNGKDLANPALAAAAWFYAKGQDIEKKPLTRDRGIALLMEIAAVAASDTCDYDSARQLVWAFQVIEGDLKRNYSNAKNVRAILSPLGEEMFLLDLRTGQKAKTGLPGEAKKRETMEIDLEKVLPFIARYEPSRFQAKFKEIVTLLK